MKPHEKIELIVTTVCAIDGLKWQDVLLYVGKRNKHFTTRFAIAHLLKEYVGSKYARDVTGYSAFMLHLSTRRYIENIHRYRAIEKYINKIIETNTDYEPNIQCGQRDGVVQGQAALQQG